MARKDEGRFQQRSACLLEAGTIGESDERGRLQYRSIANLFKSKGYINRRVDLESLKVVRN